MEISQNKQINRWWIVMLSPIAIYVGVMLGAYRTIDPCAALDQELVDVVNQDTEGPDDRIGLIGRVAVKNWRVKRFDRPGECLAELARRARISLISEM